VVDSDPHGYFNAHRNFDNAGLITLSSGAKLTNLSVGTFSNRGGLRIESAAWYINAGSMVSMGGSLVEVLGRFENRSFVNFAADSTTRVGSGGGLQNLGTLVNAGTLNVDTGGQLNLKGLVSNTGVVNLAAGSVAMFSDARVTNDSLGLISNAGHLTINGTSSFNGLGFINNAGQIQVESGSLTLDNQTLANTGSVAVVNGAKLVNNSGIDTTDGGSLTVSGAGSSFYNSATGSLRVHDGGTAVMAAAVLNDGAVSIGFRAPSGGGQALFFAGFKNNGTLNINDSGSVEIHGAQGLVNNGTVQLRSFAGGLNVLKLYDDSQNTGTFSVGQDGILQLGGSTFTNLGTVQIDDGGSVQRLGNAGATAYLQPASIAGQTPLTILNGTMAVDSAQFFGGAGLQGHGTLYVRNGAYFGPAFDVRPLARTAPQTSASRVTLGAVAAGTALSSATAPGGLTIVGDAVFDHANIVMEMPGAGFTGGLTVTAAPDGSGGHASFDGGTLTVNFTGGYFPDLDDAPTSWLRAADATGIGSVAVALNGLPSVWSANSSGGSTGLAAVNFSNPAARQMVSAHQFDPANNFGAIAVSAGEYVYNQVLFGNFGSITVDDQGRFYNRIGGQFYNNGGSTIAVASGGFMQNRGLLYGAGDVLNAGTFVNHAEGDLQQVQGSWITNRPGATMGNAGRWSIGAQATLLNQGRFTHSGTMDNRGTIDNRGGVFEVFASGRIDGSGVYFHRDGTTLVDGQLTAAFVGLAGGTLAGTGRIQAGGDPVLFQNGLAHGLAVGGVTIAPGRGQGGTLTVDGDLTTVGEQVSTLAIDLGPGGAGLLQTLGTVSFGGNLVFSLVDGYRPHSGDRYTFLDAAAGGAFGFYEVRLQSIAADGRSVLLAGPYWQPVPNSDGLGYLRFELDGQTEYAVWNLAGATATLTFTDTLVPVPEPGPAAMLAFGLAVLGWLRRGRSGL
jgi:hypothetical protein